MVSVTQELLETQQVKHWKCFIQPLCFPWSWLLSTGTASQSYWIWSPRDDAEVALAGNPLSRATVETTLPVPEAHLARLPSSTLPLIYWALWLLLSSLFMPMVSAASNQGKISSSIAGLLFLFHIQLAQNDGWVWVVRDSSAPSQGRTVSIHNGCPWGQHLCPLQWHPLKWLSA